MSPPRFALVMSSEFSLARIAKSAPDITPRGKVSCHERFSSAETSWVPVGHMKTNVVDSDRRLVYDTEEVNQCSVCGGDGSFYREGYDELCKDLPIQLYRCTVCESFYHNPRMTEEATLEFYKSGLYRATNGSNYGYELTRATRIGDYVEKMVGFKVTRCLDFGCSLGSMVDVLSATFDGAEVIGYDVYVNPETKTPVVTDKSKINGTFELITCLHTLEHLNNPTQELEWMKGKLVEGGTLMIEVPNTIEIKIPHPIIFSRKSIPILMERIGFADYVITGIDWHTQYTSNNILDKTTYNGIACVMARKNESKRT